MCCEVMPILPKASCFSTVIDSHTQEGRLTRINHRKLIIPSLLTYQCKWYYDYLCTYVHILQILVNMNSAEYWLVINIA